MGPPSVRESRSLGAEPRVGTVARLHPGPKGQLGEDALDHAADTPVKMVSDYTNDGSTACTITVDGRVVDSAPARCFTCRTT